MTSSSNTATQPCAAPRYTGAGAATSSPSSTVDEVWSRMGLRRIRKSAVRYGACMAASTRRTPPGEQHWHGGTDTTCVSHLALLEGTDDGDGTTWLELVTDEQYAAAHR